MQTFGAREVMNFLGGMGTEQCRYIVERTNLSWPACTNQWVISLKNYENLQTKNLYSPLISDCRSTPGPYTSMMLFLTAAEGPNDVCPTVAWFTASEKAANKKNRNKTVHKLNDIQTPETYTRKVI
jgi:hypothetical protein